MDMNLKENVLRYVKNRQMENKYEFVYTDTIGIPVLYNTLYAIMVLHMYDELGNIPEEEKRKLVEYISLFQEDDGLFRDKRVADSPHVDGEGWGWTHLTQHTIMALCALDAKPQKELAFMEHFFDRDYALKWTKWWAENNMWYMGNAVMYRVNFLQFMRDKCNRKEAHGIIHTILDYLDKIQDPDTGMWSEDNTYSPLNLTRAVQIDYHIWELYFYENRSLQYAEKIVDGILATQNPFGGYSIKPNSCGCEDIDSITPLVRFYHKTDYRKKGIEDSLQRAFLWVMSNMNEDGGFVNMRDAEFQYGHKLMSNKINQSDLFSTWWRSLSLAYISKVVKNETLGNVDWKFINCPGYSFYK